MVKFIQSSDWQIGMKGGGLGEAGPIVRETRVDSIHNVFKSAEKNYVDFILLCGDLFEHNMVSQEEVKKVVSIFNQYSNKMIYLLPGNHDILGADCIYNRDIFSRINHLKILNKFEPIVLENVVLHPCPIFSKFVNEDVTSKIPDVHKEEGVHIGIAHGSIIGRIPVSNWEEVDLPIDSKCTEKKGIDYLALGHWHSFQTFEDNTGIARIAYSGTHEQTKYEENNAGHCLLVEIDEKGAKPKIELNKTGKLSWTCKEFEMKDASSIKELKEYFESIKGHDLVYININGELPFNCKKEFDDIIDFQGTLHKNFRVKTNDLNYLMPTDLEVSFNFNDPTLNQTMIKLKELLQDETDEKKRKIIADALTYFLRFIREE